MFEFIPFLAAFRPVSITILSSRNQLSDEYFRRIGYIINHDYY